MKTKPRLKVVLDTNAILSSTHPHSSYRILLDALFDDVYDIFVTTEILMEYEEKITQIFNKTTAEFILGSMSLLDNIKKIDTHFKLNLIANDLDDNKFVDTAFASNAHFIVTNDKHFKVLQHIDFPKINVISVETFAEWLKTDYSPE